VTMASHRARGVSVSAHYSPTSSLCPTASSMRAQGGFWRICGGAPGVFALLGVDLCLTLEHAVTLADQWDRDEVAGQALVTLTWLACAIGNTMSMVLAEQRALTLGSNQSGGEAAHLSGFAAGIACYALLRFGSRTPLRGVFPFSCFGPHRAGARGGGRTLGGRVRP
jgi:hypothetical protein